MLIKVKVGTNIKDLGCWEVNDQDNRALFRHISQSMSNETVSIPVTDLSDKYKTIQDYLKHELKVKDVKEIIPDIKYVFSPDKIICSHITEDIGRTTKHFKHNIRHCNQPAKIYSHINGKPLCIKHAPRL